MCKGAQRPWSCGEIDSAPLLPICVSSLIRQPLQIPPIGGLAVSRRQAAQVIGGDEFLGVSHLLRAADEEPLPMLDRSDELRCLEQRVVGSGVEPGVAA